MRVFSQAGWRVLQQPQFWLLAIAGGIATIHLSLIWRSDANLNRFFLSLLCWFTIATLLWGKRHTLIFQSDIFSGFIGFSLLEFFLLRSLWMTGFDNLFYFTPFIAAIGLALLASGARHLHQYWQEIAIVFAFSIPVEMLINRIPILALYTANFAAFILTYLGVEFDREGINLILANGKAVEVAAGCSGWESIFPLLKLSVLFLVMFPTKTTQKVLIPLAAVAIAFVVNGVRVAILAILHAYTSEATFKYWHVGMGSQIFFLTSALLFGGFCYLTSKHPSSKYADKRELSEL
jgi:cyanoexosortase A